MHRGQSEFTNNHIGVCGSLVVSVLDCQSWGSRLKPRPGQKFSSRVLFHLHPLANSAMMSTVTTHCQWEDEMVRERSGHQPSYTEAKKIRSLTLHTHGCLRVSLRDWSSSSPPPPHHLLLHTGTTKPQAAMMTTMTTTMRGTVMTLPFYSFALSTMAYHVHSVPSPKLLYPEPLPLKRKDEDRHSERRQQKLSYGTQSKLQWRNVL